MPGNSVVGDKANERHGLFRRFESCNVANYSAPSARRHYAESGYGTKQGSPRITLGNLGQELQYGCNVTVEITQPVDHEVQSFDHFITESFSVGIDQLMQNLLVEGARRSGESPCMERSLDVHHSLRSLPLQLAIGGLQSEQMAFLSRLTADGRQPTVIGQIQDGERVIEVGLLAVAMLLHPRLDMPPAD